MIKKKLYIILILSFIMTVICITKVKAASVSLDVPSKVNVGDTITAKITGKSEQWNLTLSVNNEKLEETNNLTNVGSEIEISKSATYKATNVGTVTFTLTGDYSYTSGDDVKTEEVNISKSVTVEEKKEENNTDSNTISNENTTPTLSSNANLRNLGINPHDFHDFKSDKTTYYVTVPKETDKINIYATSPKNVKGQTITGTGDKKLKIGNNTFEVIVTAEDKKTTKKYVLNITRESVSKVATLKNLGINPNDFHNFKSTRYIYDVEVPYETEIINIYAEKNNDKQTIVGTGDKRLEVGKNTFTVKVAAEDGNTSKTYTLNITRKEKPETDVNENKNDDNKVQETIDENTIQEQETTKDENLIKESEISEDNKDELLGLTNLLIEEGALRPKFYNSVYEYQVEIIGKKESLNIQTQTSSENVTVEIAGNQDLKLGENIITILVRDEKNETKTYQIKAVVKPEAVDIDKVNSVINKSNQNERIKNIVMIAVGVIIVALGIAFIVTKHRYQDEKYFEDDNNKDETIIENIYENTKKDNNDFYEERNKPLFKVNGKGKRYK